MIGAPAGVLSGTYQYIETQLGSAPFCHPEGTWVNEAARRRRAGEQARAERHRRGEPPGKPRSGVCESRS